MKTLCLFSGGMDSTYLLWKLLTETGDEVIAFRFRLECDLFAKCVAGEDANVPKIVKWLEENSRPFKYLEATMTMPEGWSSPPHASYGLMAAAGALNERPDRVVSARNIEDHAWRGLIGQTIMRDVYFCTLDTSVIGGSMPEWEPIITPWDWPVRKIGKAHFLRDMPKALQGLAVTCFEPVIKDGYAHGCGECLRCRRVSRFLKSLDAGDDPDLIMDDQMRLRKLGVKYMTREVPRKMMTSGLPPKETL